jgi:peptidyl-prolyl cis-trans isomerase SurA
MTRYRRILAALVNNVRAMCISPIDKGGRTRRRSRGLCSCGAAMLLAAALFSAIPQIAEAQVVALVNGAPITEIDISQRIKIVQVTTHKTISRQESLKALVDDHLKIFIMRRYGIEPSSQEIDNQLASMAQRSHMSAQQLEQSMVKQGMSPSAFKLKIKADMGWNNLIRGKFSASFQVNDADIRAAMQSRAEPEPEKSASNAYTLYPITLVAPNGSQENARRQEAENLRSRFTSCEEGLKLARVLRGVVVRDPIKRSSADLAPQLREVLDKMEVGRLTAPEVTPQGIQMFALCERKEGDSDSPAKRAIRQELLNKRFEVESKKYLEEVRRQSMIEYR